MFYLQSTLEYSVSPLLNTITSVMILVSAEYPQTRVNLLLRIPRSIEKCAQLV